jgi:4'-phosphopantetheinyl transferase
MARRAPTSRLTISASEIHLWWIPLDDAWMSHDGVDQLDSADQQRYQRLADRGLRHRFAVTHGTLRGILAAYLGVPVRQLQLRESPAGRPFVPCAHRRDSIDFSLSHTTDLAVVAVSRRRVGVDVEQLQPSLDPYQFVARWFTRDERTCIDRHCGQGTISDGLLRHWTAKEAHLKALGLGLTGLPHTELRCRPQAQLLWCSKPDPKLNVSVFRVSKTAHAAVASPIHSPLIVHHTWAKSVLP